MPTTPPIWQSQLDALLAQHAHLPFSRFVSAASIRTDGRPANRTLTFRFFLADSRLVFTSDARSEKMEQMHVNPWVELCWYFTDARVQLRLLGEMAIQGQSNDPHLEQARIRTWNERSAQSRQAFTWPGPGLARDATQAFGEPSPEMPPPNFMLLLFLPQQVDLLDLRAVPHGRTLHVLENGIWRLSARNP